MSETVEAQFYQHSGRAGWTPFGMCLLGIPLAILMAAIYSALVVYVPLIGYVNAIFLGIYLFGLAIPLAKIGRICKCRSTFKLGLLSAIVSAVGVYFSWVFFIAFLSGGEVPIVALNLAMEPRVVWEISCDIIANGWWQNGPSGILEWIVVSIEAAIMIPGVGLIAGSQIDRDVFCEDCGTWCSVTGNRQLSLKELLPSAEADDPEEAAERESVDEKTKTPQQVDGPVEAELVMPGHLDLLKLPEAAPTEIPRVSAEVLACTGCKATSAVRFKLVSITIDSDGDPTQTEEDLPGILLQKSGEY